MLDRRQFLNGFAALAAVGFDPSAPDAGVFVVSGDVHVPNYSARLRWTIAEWNAMTPRPAFAMLLGDNVSYVSREFGHKPRSDKEWKMAADAIDELNRETAALDSAIPLRMVIGNHDSYPGEKDATFFCSHVRGGMKPYYFFDALGIRFIAWNGGNDGAIDAAQREWILKTVAATPKDTQICVFVHQPSIGSVGMERGIPEMVRDAFADRNGMDWLIAGHIHCNRFRKFDLPQSVMVEAAHPMNRDGYWIYGVKRGRIAARTFVAADGSRSVGEMPADIASEGRLRFAFEDFADIRAGVFIGDELERKYRLDIGKTADSGSWFIYLDRIRHVFPLGELAPGAKELLLLGWLDGNLKTHEPEHLLLSADGLDWIEVKPLGAARDGVYRFPIPKGLRAAAKLFTDFRSYHYDARSNLCGFAFR